MHRSVDHNPPSDPISAFPYPHLPPQPSPLAWLSDISHFLRNAPSVDYVSFRADPNPFWPIDLSCIPEFDSGEMSLSHANPEIAAGKVASLLWPVVPSISDMPSNPGAERPSQDEDEAATSQRYEPATSERSPSQESTPGRKIRLCGEESRPTESTPLDDDRPPVSECESQQGEVVDAIAIAKDTMGMTWYSSGSPTRSRSQPCGDRLIDR